MAHRGAWCPAECAKRLNKKSMELLSTHPRARTVRAKRGPQIWTPFWTPSFGPGTHTHSGPPNRVNKRSLDVTNKTTCTVEYQSRAHQQHQFCHHARPVCSCSEISRRTLQVPLSKSCNQNVLGLPTNFDVTAPRSGCSPSET